MDELKIGINIYEIFEQINKEHETFMDIQDTIQTWACKADEDTAYNFMIQLCKTLNIIVGYGNE